MRAPEREGLGARGTWSQFPNPAKFSNNPPAGRAGLMDDGSIGTALARLMRCTLTSMGRLPPIRIRRATPLDWLADRMLPPRLLLATMPRNPHAVAVPPPLSSPSFSLSHSRCYFHSVHSFFPRERKESRGKEVNLLRLFSSRHQLSGSVLDGIFRSSLVRKSGNGLTRSTSQSLSFLVIHSFSYSRYNSP